MIFVRWRPTVFLDAVFKPFFKIAHDTGQQLTIDRTNFLTDGFLQIIQRAGFVSVNTRFQIPQRKKITRWKIGRARGATARLWNGKWGARETCFEQYTTTRCSTGQVSIATGVANPEEKNADHLVPPSAYLLSTTHSKDVRFPWVTLYYFNLSHSQGQVYQALSEIISDADCWKHTFSQGLPFVNWNWHYS